MADDPPVNLNQGATVAVVGTPDPPPVVVAREEVRAEPAVVEAKVEVPVVEAPKTVADTPSALEELKAPGSEEPPKPVEGKEAPAEVPEKPAAEKPAEKPVEAQPEKPAEAPEQAAEAEKPVEPQAPPAVEYKYELPEFLVMDDAQRGELHTVLDSFRAEPGNLQPLIDYHVKALQQYDQLVSQRQQDVFLTTRKAWNEQIMSDPELGGSGYETTKATIARMRDRLVSSHRPGTPEYERDVREFQQFSRVTGAGDHPVLWRLLHNAARWLDEPQASDAQIAEIAPADAGKAPGNRKRERIYNKIL